MLGCCTYLTAEDTNSKVVDVIAIDVEVGVRESIYYSLVNAGSWQQLDKHMYFFTNMLVGSRFTC